MPTPSTTNQRISELEEKVKHLAAYVARLNVETIGSNEPTVAGRLLWRSGSWQLAGVEEAREREWKLAAMRAEAARR